MFVCPVGRQNLAHPQIQQLGDGAVFESSDKILPWFCCSGTSSDGLFLRSVPARTSSSKTLPCVSSCWLSTPNNLGGDSLPSGGVGRGNCTPGLLTRGQEMLTLAPCRRVVSSEKTSLAKRRGRTYHPLDYERCHFSARGYSPAATIRTRSALSVFVSDLEWVVCGCYSADNISKDRISSAHDLAIETYERR